jgi:hypothetical protein
MSSRADARRTAPVNTRRGSGFLLIEARGIEYLWKYISYFHSTEITRVRQYSVTVERFTRRPADPKRQLDHMWDQSEPQKSLPSVHRMLSPTNMRELRRSL